MEVAARGLQLGEAIPDFSGLLGTDGSRYSLESFRASPQLALIFVGNGCPSVKAFAGELDRIDTVFGPLGAQIVAVNTNNASLSPPDTYRKMVQAATERSWRFPYLKDDRGALARACGALTTPHAFLFDCDRRLRYRGRLSDSRDPAKATRNDLIEAIQDLQAGREVQIADTMALGCSIVW